MPATFSDVGGGNWIFVSHSIKDLTEVRGIRNFLETKGHNPILFYLRSLQDDDLLSPMGRRVLARVGGQTRPIVGGEPLHHES